MSYIFNVTIAPEQIHLVFHECNKGRNDDGNTFAHQSGQLVAKRFSSTSRHDNEGVFPFKNAFNDFLRGGFGTPDDGFILIWRHSDLSRQRLGYGETLHWLEERVQDCHPSWVAHLQERIVAAHRQEGETLFDTLVSIILDHTDIELRLE